MVFQNPMISLNPRDEDRQADHRAAQDPPRDGPRRTPARPPSQLLRDVRIPEAERRLDQYPHELSGGMRQRVMIAIALACGPTMLFADEPTTALDVTVQAQILDLIGEQRRDRNMSVILVTHDLGVVAGHTDQIAVMYGGKLVETGPDQDAVRRHEDAVHQGADAQHPEARATRATRGCRRSPADHPTSSTRRTGCRFAPRCAYARDKCRAGGATARRRPTTPITSTPAGIPVGSPEFQERDAELAASAAMPVGIAGAS